MNTMRKYAFAEGEYYHVYSHAIGDMDLFRTDRDYKRFLTTLFVANGKRDISHLDRFSDLNLVSDIRDGKVNIGNELVDIVGFCCMPSHFHLVLRENKNGNISVFMHKLLVSYAKYFNLKHERRGHVFERTFDSKHLNDNEYLLRALAYVHLNPRSIKGWKRSEHKYPWSSFQDYVIKNRWGKLLETEFLLNYFDFDKKELKHFTNTAGDDDYTLDQISCPKLSFGQWGKNKKPSWA